MRPITNAIANRIETMFLEPNFKTQYGFIEEQLATSPDDGEFLCGKELTGADIMMSFPLLAARGRSTMTKEKYPNIWAYLARIESRETYRVSIGRIIARVGTYSLI